MNKALSKETVYGSQKILLLGDVGEHLSRGKDLKDYAEMVK